MTTNSNAAAALQLAHTLKRQADTYHSRGDVVLRDQTLRTLDDLPLRSAVIDRIKSQPAEYTIVRTTDLDLAARKASHGCSDALCGDCDQ